MDYAEMPHNKNLMFFLIFLFHFLMTGSKNFIQESTIEVRMYIHFNGQLASSIRDKFFV